MKIETITEATDNPVQEFFSSSNTPETDEAQCEGLLKGCPVPTQVVHAQHARRLERERNEALEQERIHYENLLIMKQKFDHEATENMLSTNKICNQRDQAMDVLSNLSHYLSCGLGDENTTAQEYGARIREGIITMINPLLEEKEKLRHMLELQTKLVVALEMKKYNTQKNEPFPS